MFSFPDVDNMRYATLHLQFCHLLLWFLSFLYSRREGMWGGENSAQKGFPAHGVLALL